MNRRNNSYKYINIFLAKGLYILLKDKFHFIYSKHIYNKQKLKIIVPYYLYIK